MIDLRCTGPRRLRLRGGQGLVEFVLVAPFLLLLIFGVVEFARAWNIRHVMTDAAREAARVLAVRSDSAAAYQAISAAFARSGMTVGTATIAFTNVTTPGGDPGSEVRIQYPFRLGITGALLKWALPQQQLNIHTAFTMRNE